MICCRRRPPGPKNGDGFSPKPEGIFTDGTRLVSPWPAFDLDCNLIPLAEYSKALCGAVVEAHFALHFRRLEDPEEVEFLAVVRKLVVLRPPPDELNRAHHFSHSSARDHMAVQYFV
jgi:hypothetical protein